jgi:hypothetical protein
MGRKNTADGNFHVSHVRRTGVDALITAGFRRTCFRIGFNHRTTKELATENTKAPRNDNSARARLRGGGTLGH